MKHLFRSLVCALALTGLQPALAGPVDINQADAAALSSGLKGVGPAKAEAIIAYRNQHGPFRSAEDLANVEGIGPRTIEMNRGNIQIGQPPAK